MAAERGKNILSGAKMEVLDREYDLEQDGGKEIKDPDSGRVVGTYNRDTNEVKLFRGATIKTLVHELGGHATLRFAEQEAARGDRALLDRINKVIDEAPQEVKDEVRKRYPKAGDAELRDEIWAALRERNSPAMEKAIKTLQGKAWYNRAWAAFKDAWKGLLSRMGLNRADLSKIDRMSNDEFLDFLDRTMAEGKTLGKLEKGGASGTRNMAITQDEYDRWNKVLDDYEAGNLKPNSHATVFEHTPAVLKRLGAPDLPVSLSKDIIDKITGIVMTKSGESHEIPVSELRNLQIELDNPIAVFDSRTRPDAMVVLTRIVDRQNHERAVVALHLDKVQGAIHVNDIASAYGKDKQSIENWTAWGLLRYVNKQARKSSAKWFQLPSDLDLRAHSVLTENDFSSDELGKIVPNPAAESKGADESPTRQSRAPASPGSRILDDIQTKAEKIKEKFYDRYAPVQSVQDEIGGVKEVVGKDGYTDHRKSTDFVAAADKANGREEALMRNLQKDVDRINGVLARGDVSLDLFDKYLLARHAAERNMTVQLRERGTYDATDGFGSGMSEQDAKAFLSSAEVKAKEKWLKAASNLLYRVNNADIKLRVSSDRLSQNDADHYLNQWDSYVPLKTDMERLEPDALNSSTAGMKRNEFMKARGRAEGNIAASPFAASILQAEQGIRGAVRNELNNVLANLVGQATRNGLNDSGEFAEIVHGDTLPQGAGYTFTFGDGARLTAGGDMKLVSNHPETFLFKRDGELYAIRFNKGANGRGLAVAKAASGENMGKWGSGMEWVPRFTHWMSAMRTQYSPEFTVSNLLADHL